jgi:hypothetical protein
VNFEALIQERIRDARNRNIYGKARLVANLLGSYSPKKHGGYYRYRNGPLSITWDTYAPNLWVWFNGVEVFTVHLGDVTRYRPDIDGWIQLLEEAYKQAKAERERREAEEFSKRLAELKERWGLCL